MPETFSICTNCRVVDPGESSRSWASVLSQNTVHWLQGLSTNALTVPLTRKPSLEAAPITSTTFSRQLLAVLIYSFQSRSHFQPWSHTAFHNSVAFPNKFDSFLHNCDCELWPMTLTIKHDIDKVKVNEHILSLCQRSFGTHAPRTQHTTNRLLYMNY